MLEMRGRLERSPEGSPKSSDAFRALTRGPIVLARDKRLGADVHEKVEIQADAEGVCAARPDGGDNSCAHAICRADYNWREFSCG